MILTKIKTDRQNRNKKLIKMFNKLNVNGSDKMAVCEIIANKNDIKTITVYKIVSKSTS